MKKIIFCFATIVFMGLMFASCEREDNESTTPGGGNNNTSQDTPSDPVEWVDLGLPSGLLWRSCNLGATTPEEFGDYYAWGETQTKSIYNWDNYIYGDHDGDNETWTMYKYNTNETYGAVDNLRVLEPADDAATVVLGAGARIPTQQEWQELISNTSGEWTEQNGVNGWKFTAENGNSLFLPAAGRWMNETLYEPNHTGSYWSSSLITDYTYFARYYSFQSIDSRIYFFSRFIGCSIRPVKAGNNK